MTRTELSNLLHHAEESFTACWSVLVSMKEHQLDAAGFLQFQGRLCHALDRLSGAYRTIHQERQALIARKKRLNHKWFVRRQSALDSQQKMLTNVIGIGRCLGDSFAWFFYQNNTEYLLEHARLPLNRYQPPGIGGIGEREFATKVRRIGTLMVVYHGTTTILRIGDVSLIDLVKMRVAALGEIKTSPLEPGKISISLEFSGTRSSLKQFEQLARRPSKAAISTVSLPPAFVARLQRQMKKIRETIGRKPTSSAAQGIRLQEKRRLQEFEALLHSSPVGKFVWRKLGPGLLCGAYRTKATSFYNRHRTDQTSAIGSKLDELVPHAKGLLLDESPYNELSVGTMLYSRTGMPRLLPGTIPLFWWPIDTEQIRGIIFQELICTHTYNPAHFLTALQEKGFTIVPSDGKNGIRLRMPVGPATVEFVGIWYYIDLIVHGLFHEAQVIDILSDMAEQIRRNPPVKPTRYDIAFSHKIMEYGPNYGGV